MVDWADQITNESLLRLIATNFPIYWASLNVGTVQRTKAKRSYRTPIEHLTDQCEWLKAEWYGGTVSGLDPEKQWNSYLSVNFREGRELTICLSSADSSMENLLQFIVDASKLGNLGYGYGDDWDAPGLTYYIAGITYGLPCGEEEKRKADRLSRWFRERLPMPGNPPRKRYLEGMYRGVYQINVLNRSHVVESSQEGSQPRGLDHIVGRLLPCDNDTFIWSVPTFELAEVECDLGNKELLI